MRKEDINSFIQTLLTKGHVVLPGIGLFSIHDQHAHIDLEKKLVSPPYRDIIYKQTGNWFHSFQSRPNWLQEISSYCLAQLRNAGKCEIPQIGELYSDEQNQYSFEVDKRYWGKEAGYRGTLSFSDEEPHFVEEVTESQPLIESEELTVVQEQEEETVTKTIEKKKKEDLGVIGSMAAAALTVIDKVPLTEESSRTTSSNFSDSHAAQEVVLPQKTRPAQKPREKSKGGPVLWWMLPLMLLAAFVLCIKMCDVFKTSNTANVVPANVIEERVNQTPGHSEMTSAQEDLDDSLSHVSETHPVEEKVELVNESEDDHHDDSQVDEVEHVELVENNYHDANHLDCAIIVGAFAKSSNANRMVEHIESLGHVAYIKEVDGLKRVGLLSHCSGEEFESLLNFAKTEINEDAWLAEIKQ